MANGFNPPKMSKPTITYFLSLLSLGLGDYYTLRALYWVGFVMTIIVSLVVLAVLIAYVIKTYKDLGCAKSVL